MNYNDQVLKDKVDMLNEEAWQKRIYDSPASLRLSEEALQCLGEIDHPVGRANALKCYGFALVRLSKNNEALPILTEAKTIFEAVGDVAGEAAILEYLAIIERNWGQYSKSFELLKKSLQISQQYGLLEIEATGFYQLGVTCKYLGHYEQALDYFHKCLQISRSINFVIIQAYVVNVIGAIYFEIENYTEALKYYQQALTTRHDAGDKWGEAGSLDNIGAAYIELEQWSEAEDYCSRSLAISQATNDKRGEANALFHLSQINKHKRIIDIAHQYLDRSLQIRRSTGDRKGEAELLIYWSELLMQDELPELEIQAELNLALQLSDKINAAELSGKAHWYLYESEKRQSNFDKALMHLERYQAIEKQLHKDAVGQKVVNLQISQRAEQSEKDAVRLTIKNEELANLNEDLKKQKEETEKAYQQLKATQAQLIQTEKMASLGELTAGIAHEIQNPLNFVNNFSELSKELLDEMKKELDLEKLDEAKEIARDVIQNLEKIVHHGQRADAIVKGMLQHSQASKGEKQPTDINAFADEYLRLAYHGIRVKDKSFNITLNTDFDENIGRINIIPQDIGRVILNLITNAFYTCAERSRSAVDERGQSASAEPVETRYQPMVSITTIKKGNKVEVRVRDNGSGIPQHIIDKIFQPFFTTKPTGQGTGLGLSLAYDIVKAHGGELRVETKEGEGSEFAIQLSAV